MRRLPIYFLIDISESMVGEPIQQVEEGISTIIQALKTDPVALETVWVSVIAFAGQPKTLVSLQEIISFYPPKFPVGSGTSLSKALGHLMFELKHNTVTTTAETKGDWKPIIFLFTDGVPTDDSQQAIREWKQKWGGRANLVAISFGTDTDAGLLSQLTENLLYFENTDVDAYKDFFKWVTASIKTSSQSVESNSSGFELAQFGDETITKIDPSESSGNQNTVDTNFVVISAKCQNTKKPYLIKYRKDIKPNQFGDLGFNTLSYRLVGAFKVDNSYYELSDDSNTEFRINTEELIGAPTCPCCGNQFGLAACSCGKIHCVGDEALNTCPWCNMQATYGTGGGGFDINRTQG